MSWLRGLLGGVPDPPPAPEGDPVRIAEVEEVLESLRPHLRADGGDVRVVAVEGGCVRLRLVGACDHCAVSALTLRGAIEPELRRRVAWVEEVRAD